MATVLLARQLLTPLERIDNAAVVIEDGIIAAVRPMTDNTITADIIADGLHVQPDVVDLFLRVKGWIAPS